MAEVYISGIEGFEGALYPKLVSHVFRFPCDEDPGLSELILLGDHIM